MNSFYKRTLPSETCTPFDSAEGRSIFRQALEDGYMESYFPLSMHLLTQSDPAFCGISSLCMVLNALQVDPGRTWKGVWRWYEDTMLDCCRPLNHVRKNGIVLSEFACLAKCNGLIAQVYSSELGATKEVFRKHLKAACRGETREIMVVSYSRKVLQQTGSGHYSPVGAYDESSDKALIMDVARFKYPLYWVSLDLLWESMLPSDPVTGKSRGYIMLSKRWKSDTSRDSQLFQLTLTMETVESFFTKLTDNLLNNKNNYTELFREFLLNNAMIKPRLALDIHCCKDESDEQKEFRLSLKEFLINHLKVSTLDDACTELGILTLCKSKEFQKHVLGPIDFDYPFDSIVKTELIEQELDFLVRQLESLIQCLFLVTT